MSRPAAPPRRSARRSRQRSSGARAAPRRSRRRDPARQTSVKRKPRLPTSALTGALASTETADVANFAAQVVCQADTVFAGTVFFAATAWVIRPARSRYGPRPRWGQIEYAQVAITVLHPKGLPQNFNESQLTAVV